MNKCRLLAKKPDALYITRLPVGIDVDGFKRQKINGSLSMPRYNSTNTNER